MTATMQMRPMTADDIPAVIALSDTVPEAPHWRASAYQAALNPSGLPPRIALVAEGPASGVAGFAIASLAGAEAELESIAVAPAWQRQGVARSIFRRLAAELAGHGVCEIFLEVRPSNQPARSLYSSLGFQEAGRRVGYYANPPEDALVMRFRIGDQGSGSQWGASTAPEP